MKVSLLIPPTSLETDSYGKLQKFSYPMPSIGLAYIAAVLEANGYDVRIIDAYATPCTIDGIVEKLDGVAVLGVSLLTTSACSTYKLAKEIKHRYPNIKIVYGNVHASLFPQECFAEGGADFIVHQEGELTFLELCDFISGKKKVRVEEIKGISYMADGDVRANPLRPFIDDLDSLPYPAWHLYDLSRYANDPRTEVIEGVMEFQILATRGCPMECTFCSSRTDKSLGNRYRMRRPEKIVEELQYMHDHYGARVFHFMDLSFPLLKKHAIEFCQAMVKSGLAEKIKWLTELRVKPLDEETVMWLKKSGCVRVYFGIESGDDEVLKKIKKGFTCDDVRSAVKLCHKAGLQVDGLFMLGLPADTVASMNKTIDIAIELGVRFAIFNLFVPYPGCQLYDELSAQKKIHFKDWSDFISYPTYSNKEPVFVTDGLTKNELMRIQSTAMKRFYLRPQFIWNQIINFKLSHISYYISGLKGVLTVK